MKAIVWTKYGPPDGLQLREIDKPAPRDMENVFLGCEHPVLSELPIKGSTLQIRMPPQCVAPAVVALSWGTGTITW
jgi:hypothetical protein